VYWPKGLELAVLPRGDLVWLPNFGVCPSIGDLERVTDENGDELEANASNPERLRLFEGDKTSSGALVKLDNGFEGAGPAKEMGAFFPEEKILGPFAVAAKGETEM